MLNIKRSVSPKNIAIRITPCYLLASSQIIKNVTAVKWWRSQNDVAEIIQVLPVVIWDLCASMSSADIERMFFVPMDSFIHISETE